MIQWNNLSFEERMEIWSQHRSDLKYVDKIEAKEVVVKFFRDVPIGSRSFDFYTPENWPTPWEILHESMFCESGISLMMYYSLKVNGNDDVRLWLINDGNDTYLVPVVDDCILNYSPGEAVHTSQITTIDIVDKINDDQVRKI